MVAFQAFDTSVILYKRAVLQAGLAVWHCLMSLQVGRMILVTVSGAVTDDNTVRKIFKHSYLLICLFI